MQRNLASGEGPSGFTCIPNAILRDPELDPLAKLVYVGLASYAWQGGSAWPSHETLARELNIGHRTVGRKLELLAERGLVQVERRAGNGRPNLYTLAGRGASLGRGSVSLVQGGASERRTNKTNEEDAVRKDLAHVGRNFKSDDQDFDAMVAWGERHARIGP